MRFLLTFLWVGLITLPALADYQFLGDYRSHQLRGHQLTLTSDSGQLALSFHQGGVVRVTLGKPRPSWAIVASLPTQSPKLEEGSDRLVLRHGEFTVEVLKSPLRLRFLRGDGSLVMEDDPAFAYGVDGNEKRTWKKLRAEERFFGLGEKTGAVDKRGRSWTMWNSDIPAYRDDTDPIYSSIPFFIGMNGGKSYGVFLDNSFRSQFNLGAGNDRIFSFGAEDGPLDYYLFPGPAIETILDQYTRLTGRMHLPPKWALGYQQCRWSYYPDYEIRDLARNFRQRKIPADVLYFDIHYMDAYKVFSWHPERFPNPTQLLQDLKQQGFKVVTIIDPGVKVEPGYDMHDEGKQKGYFATYPDGQLYRGQVWPGWCYFPDFTKEAARRWWGSHDAALRKQGVAGFWNDMNEPAVWGREMPLVVQFAAGSIKEIHNLFGFLMAQATFEGLLADDPTQRPFVVTRASFAGIQRYAAVWTGDNSASFDDLQLSIRMALGLGLSGVPFVGCDIGGFIGRPDPELYVRWMQAGALTPFMRSHTVHDSPDQEPWSFGESTEAICKRAIEQRYAWMPYYYSEFHRARNTGLPVLRPVWLENPTVEELFKHDYQHQFMVGPFILAAPVTEEGRRSKKVYLPGGKWWDVHQKRLLQGPGEFLVAAPLEVTPLFYKQGAILPFRSPTQYVDEKPLTELEVTLVPGADGDYRLTLDDGLTQNGPTDHLDFSMRGRKVTVKAGKGPFAARIQRIRWTVAGDETKSFTTAREGVFEF